MTITENTKTASAILIKELYKN